MLHNKTLDLKSPNQLTQTIQTLSSGLKSIQPDNSQLTKTITYTLLATAVIGIAVYHYIKSQEFSQEQKN